MKIIVRTTGERTEKTCIESCERQGKVHVIRAFPFGEAIRQTYELAKTFDQEWTPVIDADVVLYPDCIMNALKEDIPKNAFCYDGKTDDKIMLKSRRAGIHIYKTDLLESALNFIDNAQLKPESHVRREMEKLGYITYTGNMIFGKHDFDQYYSDLWRKSVCQTKKLAKMISRDGTKNKWLKLSKTDLDYKIVLEAHNWSEKHNPEIIIDARIDYDCKAQLSLLGIKEKNEII